MKLGLVLALLLATSTASAAVPMTLDLQACPDIPLEPVQRLVELELRATVVPPSAQGSRVTARCVAGPAGAELEVNDTVTGKSLRRVIDLGAAGSAGAPRLLALAIIELVAASWTELVISPALAAAAPGELRTDALARVARARPEPRVQIDAAGLLHGLPSSSLLVAGAALRLTIELPHALALPIEISYEHGQRDFELGSISVDLITASLGLGWRRSWTRWAVELGGGLRGGAARFDGRPRDGTVRGDSFYTPWLGPVLSASVALRPARRLSLALGLDAGWAVAPTAARVAGQNAIDLTGFFLGASLRIGVRSGG